MTHGLTAEPGARSAQQPYPLWHPMTRMRQYLASPVVIVEGHGNTLVDDSGQRLLSANAALWNVATGFDDPQILDAIRKQLDLLPYGTLFRYAHQPAIDLAHRLIELVPGSGLTRVYYATSGGSAVDAALKLVRRYQRLIGRPDRAVVAALADGYHGTLYGSMAVTGEDLEQDEYGVDRRYVRHVPTPVDDPEPALRALAEVSDQLAAVIVEPVLGSAGVVVPHPDFFAALGELQREQDVLVIVDEVATGFGRTGRMFAHEWFDLHPDILVLSKAITNGYLPLAALLVHERVWHAFDAAGVDFLHGETQAGNPLARVAAIATIDAIVSRGLVQRAERMGQLLRQRLVELLPRAGGQAGPVVGLGLVLGVRLGRPGQPADPRSIGAVVERFRDHGVIVHPSNIGISLFPPLTVTEQEVEQVCAAAAAVFEELTL